MRAVQGARVTLMREKRDYHWAWDDDGGWDYDYTQPLVEAIETRTVDLGTSAVRVDFPVEWGDYRLEVYDPATKLTTRYPFTAGWSWDDENRGLDARPDKVKLALDKTHYRAGDTLKVTRDAAARRRRPADGRERPHALRPGHRRRRRAARSRSR